MLGLVPHFVDAVNALEAAVWASPLPRRTHELVRMRIAEINGCVLCMTWRNDWADEASLAAVSHYATSDLFSDAETTALEYAERFATHSTHIDDDLLWTRLPEGSRPATCRGRYATTLGGGFGTRGSGRRATVTERDDASPTVASSLGIEPADCWDPARPDGPVGPWDPAPPARPAGLWGPTGGTGEPWDPTRPDASAASSDLRPVRGPTPPGSHGERPHRWTGIAGYAAVAAAAAIGGALVGGRRPATRRWYPSSAGPPSTGR